MENMNTVNLENQYIETNKLFLCSEKSIPFMLQKVKKDIGGFFFRIVRLKSGVEVQILNEMPEITSNVGKISDIDDIDTIRLKVDQVFRAMEDKQIAPIV